MTLTDLCPSCLTLGEKTDRVGTYKCNRQECRVHFYQRGTGDDSE